MKIVLLGTAYPYRGGLANFNERLIQEFFHQGWEARVYNFKVQYPNFLFPGKSQFSDEKNPLSSIIPNERMVNSINPFNWLIVGWKLYHMKPDVLLFRYWLPFMAPSYSVIGFLAKLNGTTKIVTIVDNAIPHEPKFYDIPVTKLFFKISDFFVAMSEKVITDFGKLSPKRIKLLQHPMYDNYGPKIKQNEAKASLGFGDEANILLFFGFIREYKGLDWLIEAMADKKIQEKNIKLVIAGEFYIPSESYYNRVKELGIEDSIVWKTDFIPDSEVSKYFCMADAVILPYKNATQSGITQIAYYYETPIIATQVGGLSEIIPNRKTGLIVQPNPISISEGINTFYEEKLAKTLSYNMIEEKKKFSWESLVGNIIAMIKENK